LNLFKNVTPVIKAEFSDFRNLSWCSRNISDHHPCWRQWNTQKKKIFEWTWKKI